MKTLNRSRDAGGIVGKIDRDERKRVRAMADTARGNRASVTMSTKTSAKTKAADVSRCFSLQITVRELGLTREGVNALLTQQLHGRMAAQQFRQDHPPVVHVKNGKPLTAEGARMLGTPWPADQTQNEVTA